MKKLTLLILALFSCAALKAQENVVGWNAEWYASARLAGGIGQYMPFWSRTGEDGILPVTNSGLLTAGADLSYRSRKGIFFETGVNVVGALAAKSPLNTTPVYGFFDRLYLSAGWRMLRMDVGLKPRHGDLGSLSVTQGDIMLSGNARNLPGLNLSADWIYFEKGKWFGIKGNLAHYHLFDKRYFSGAMIHDKSVAIRIAAGRKLEFMAGFHHYAQWGGVSEQHGTHKFSLKNYIKVFFAQRGGAEDSLFDQLNVYGNHLGNEWLRLIWRTDNYSLTFQYDKPFEDNSGMIFKNFPDGVWTLKYSNNDREAVVTDVVCEFINTTWQSGPLHDRPATEEEKAMQDPELPYYGKIILGGRDDYFNNSHYLSGWTHYGRSMGLPLLTTYAPDENGLCRGIMNSRVRGYHIGVDGLIAKVPYRFKATFTENFGTYLYPLPSKLCQLSLALEASLTKAMTGLPVTFSLGVYGDVGKLYQNSAGLTLKVTCDGSCRF